MARSWQLVDPKPELVAEVAAHLRPADIEEIAAGSGRPPEAAILAALASAEQAWAIIVAGRPVAVVGTTELTARPGSASAWAFVTTAAARVPLAFHKGCRAAIQRMAARWPELLVGTWSRRRDTRAWLERIGFEAYGSAEVESGEVFHLLRRRSACVSP